MLRILVIANEYRRSAVDHVKRFIKGEAGESSVMANIMMLAIAALIVILLLAFGRTGMDFLKQKWSEMTSG